MSESTCPSAAELNEPGEPNPLQGRIIRKLRVGWGTDGLLHRVVPEGDDYIIACVGKAAILLPNQPLKTKGGQVDLRDWIGQEVEIRNVDGTLRTRLMPVDKKEIRIFELEETMTGMIGQCRAGSPPSLENASKVLGLPENFTDKDLTAFHKLTAFKEARARAERSVKSGFRSRLNSRRDLQ